MATTDAIVNVKVAGLATLQQLQNSLGRVNGRFAQLRTAVAGIGLAAFTRNTLVAADGMVDLANATGLTIEQVIDLQFALQEAGGRLDQVGPAVLKFSTYLDEARQEAGRARASFNELGISTEDLGRFDTATLLEKTIRAIAAQGVEARRTALTVEFLGKALREADVKKFAQELQSTIGTNGRYAESVARAAKLNGDLDRALLTLRLQFLEMISPIVNLINYMNSGTKAADALRIALEALAVVALVAFGGAVGRGIATIIGSLGRMYNAVKRSTNGWKAAREAAQKSAQETAEAYQKLDKAARKGMQAPATGKELEKQLDKAANTATKLKNWEATSGDFMNRVRGWAVGIGASFGFVTAAVSGISRAMQGGGGEFAGGKGATGTWGEATEAVNANTQSIDKNIEAIKQQTLAYAQQQQDLLKNIKFQTDSLNLNEDEIAVLEARNTVLDAAKQQIRDFENQIATLNDEQKHLKPILEEQIAIIKKRMNADADAAGTATEAYRQQSRAQQELIADIELLNQVMSEQAGLDALQRQAELIGLVGDELTQANILLENETQLQARLAEIEGKRRRASMELKGSLLQAELDRLQREEDAARASADRKLQIEKDLNEKTKALRNDTAYATELFLEELARSIDPAVLAAQRYETVFKHIEDAISNLVTTGKFNFKDFALAIVADLLKIELRLMIVRALMAAIGAITGGGPTAAVSSSVSPIPGVGFAANGANTLAGKPFIVGEQGPELFVPKTAGSIVPNDMMGGQVNAPVTNNYNTYNINAVDAKSVAQLFAENRKSLLSASMMAQKEMPYMAG